jgi:hypothetical protein
MSSGLPGQQWADGRRSGGRRALVAALSPYINASALRGAGEARTREGRPQTVDAVRGADNAVQEEAIAPQRSSSSLGASKTKAARSPLCEAGGTRRRTPAGAEGAQDGAPVGASA